MKLLLDQGLPRSSAELLRAAGMEVVHTAECGLSRADDGSVLAFGRAEGRVIVTLDADFHTMLALEAAPGPSVIRLRWEGLRARDVADIVVRVIAVCRNDLETGAAISVTPDGIRLRQLPMTGQQPDEQEP